MILDWFIVPTYGLGSLSMVNHCSKKKGPAQKMWKYLEKRPFFWADMAGLGKYHMGGCGWIGVYRVKTTSL